MRRFLYQCLFRFLGVHRLYRELVVEERQTGIRAAIRQDLVRLLETVNRENPFFAGRYTAFLDSTRDAGEDEFFREFSKIPPLGKEAYARAGMSVMPSRFQHVDPGRLELRFRGRPLEALWRLRKGGFLMPMATGGTTSCPLVVQMTRDHMFSMLFTFFKCWYRMGWRPGDRMLIFYPRDTYNIDEMVRFNAFRFFTGFHYHLFDRVDEATVRSLVGELNRFRPRLLLVFPSTMNMIAHTIRRCSIPLKHQPALINVSGETFFDCQRENIRSVFPRSRMEDSYGSVELGEIAHESDGGLEVFARVAFVETEPNEHGQPEMIVTTLRSSDFPFIRYRMKDLARVRLDREPDGREKYVLAGIEGKDTNFILNDRGERFVPSHFNRMVNEVNRQTRTPIVEIKVWERGQSEIEICLIVAGTDDRELVSGLIIDWLREHVSESMRFSVRFADFTGHDYRRKYRVIERIGDVEFAGGIVGDRRKTRTVAELAGDREDPAISTR